MKSQPSVASLAVLAVLCLTLAALPASAQTSYDSGLLNDSDRYPWQSSRAYAVSGNFVLSSDSAITDFSFGEYWATGDPTLPVDWTTTTDGGGFIEDQGRAKVANVSGANLKNKQTVGTGTMGGLNAPLSAGAHWLDVSNDTAAGADPVYGDKNTASAARRVPRSGASAPSHPNRSPSTAPAGVAATTPGPIGLLMPSSGVMGLGGSPPTPPWV